MLKKADGLNPTEKPTQFHGHMHGHSRQRKKLPESTLCESQHVAMADTPFTLNSHYFIQFTLTLMFGLDDLHTTDFNGKERFYSLSMGSHTRPYCMVVCSYRGLIEH